MPLGTKFLQADAPGIRSYQTFTAGRPNSPLEKDLIPTCLESPFEKEEYPSPM